MVYKPAKAPSKCANCGVSLKIINVGSFEEPDFRRAHPHGFKAACDLLAQRRREQAYLFAGQMFYDPVMQQFEWRTLNV